MVNMQMSADEAKEWASPTPSDAPKYPYGLGIGLCEDDLVKLGITTLPAVGATLTLQALVTVTGTSTDSTQGEGDERRVSLQITDMELGSAGKTQASRIYGGD